MISGCAAMALGAFLPWIKMTAPFVGTVTKSATEGGDGWFLVGFAVVAALVAFGQLGSSKSGVGAKVAGVVCALAAAGLLIYEFHDISGRFAAVHDLGDGDTFFGVNPGDLVATSYGVGLWMSAIGTGLLATAALALKSGKGAPEFSTHTVPLVQSLPEPTGW